MAQDQEDVTALVKALPAGQEDVTTLIKGLSPDPHDPHMGPTPVFPWRRTAAKTAVNTLPGLGGIAGAVLGGGPEDVPAMAIGAGVGQALRDLVAEKIGLEPETTPAGKAGRIALESLTAWATPAVLNKLVNLPAEALGKVAAKLVKYGFTAGGAAAGGPVGAVVGGSLGDELSEMIKSATKAAPKLVKGAATAAEDAVSVPGYPRYTPPAPTQPTSGAAAVSAPPSAPIAAPGASTPVSGAVAANAPGMAAANSSVAQTLNALAIQAKRAGVTLSEDGYKLATMYVKKGMSPQQAVAAVASTTKTPFAAPAMELPASWQQMPTDAEAKAAIAARQYKR